MQEAAVVAVPAAGRVWVERSVLLLMLVVGGRAAVQTATAAGRHKVGGT